MQRLFIKVEGIVQGVGFRPFVYKLANFYLLKGWVKNSSEGVLISIEGNKIAIIKFLDSLKNNPPLLARVEKIIIEDKPLEHYTNFDIRESVEVKNKITLVSPDMSICNDCLEDIKDLNNRRYQYAFTNCTNCGPRFSIIKDIPYDRRNTSMKVFKMCPSCKGEYNNPLNRRFHAEPNGCKCCGPSLWFLDSSGKVIAVDIDNVNPIALAKEKLKNGNILAVKGLGGFHFVCDAKSTYAVKTLRNRKKRLDKPLAVMMRDITSVKEYCEVNKIEEDLLIGNRKPIVILNQKDDYTLPKILAPNQKTLGVMLPYTPLHKLLFDEELEVLIMTSANIHGLPLEYINHSAFEKLKSIADYFLVHNRDIHIPVDDSVVKVINNEARIIRRSRGYTPAPFKGNNTREILACGSNMKNSFCISKDGFQFLSQHNGDLENMETYEHYMRNIDHFKHIFSFSPKYIAYDMHPGYMSSKYANEYANEHDIPKIEVQHHHAHIASCMAENNIENKIIGVAFDGTGYGTDGNLWGGEFFICDIEKFSRVAHLNYISMPGGEMAVKEPLRMAIAYIYENFKKYISKFKTGCIGLKPETAIISSQQELKNLIKNLYGDKGLTIVNIIKSNINCPKTSSMGRLFDSVSSLIGIKDVISYEGQAAAELEALVDPLCNESYQYTLSKDNPYIIETDEIIFGILKDRLNGASKGKIAAKFHNTVVNFTIELCSLLRYDYGINEIALSGGVFQNTYLLTKITINLEKKGFVVYSHKLVPTNDGGIALGQLVIANSNISNMKRGIIK